MKKITVLIPAHNEERNISSMVNELRKVFSEINYDFECVFVDDGSTDNTLNEIKLQNQIYPNVHFIELSKNFGKDQALQAGISFADSDAVITMDADLQHPPLLIKELIMQWEKGFDVVYTYRDKANLHANVFQRVSSRLFYKVLNKLSDIKIEDGISDFRLIDKKVVTELKGIKEFEIFFRGIVKWVGFKQKGIRFTPVARRFGEASYNTKKLIQLALSSTMSFSVKPLYVATFLGLVFSALSLAYIPYILISYFGHYTQVSGWASLIATISFFGGLQLFVLGIIGTYLGKLFMQSKQRPNFIVRSSSYHRVENDLIKFRY